MLLDDAGPDQWLIDPGIAYLNHGGYGALPVPVAAAATALRQEIEGNPSDVFTRRWQGLVDGVRVRVGELLRTQPSDLVFVPNATTGTATVLSSLGLGAGDEIVATDHRYPAVASQLDVLAGRGVRIIETPIELEIESSDQIVAAVLGNVTPRTRLIVIDQIASPTGFAFPVAAIVAAAHGAGVPVLVDAAHAPGQIDVDVSAIGADFWVGNLHKWVCSPRACAVLYVAPQWQHRVQPLVASHEFAAGYQPAFDWTGTADPLPLLTVPAALDYWADLGWEQVRRRQHELATNGARHVADRLGTQVPISEKFTAAMRLVELPQPMSQAAGIALLERMTLQHKVTAHVTHHQGRSFVRVCGQLYNVPEHYERLADALRTLL